jgi:uncharacterized protein
MMGFSVRCDRTGIEYSGSGFRGLFAQRRNLLSPKLYRLILDFFRFQTLTENWTNAEVDCTTIRDFFKTHNFSSEFKDLYFLPMASAIWSCPRAAIEQFPIEFVIRFYHHHGLLGLWGRPQWYVIQGGSRTYVEQILKRFNGAVETNTPVQAIRREHDGVQVRAGDTWRNFDHAILACHADQSLEILGQEATRTERDLLSAFPYEPNAVTLHTDVNLLPKCKAAWASWNYLLPTKDEGKATVTYNMNILQDIKPTTGGRPSRLMQINRPSPAASVPTFCVTLNGDAYIRPETILRKFRYEHPIYTLRRSEAQRRHTELVGHQRVSYCGAYWGNGFHEDGVRSALKVCDWINSRSPDHTHGTLAIER